MKKTYIAPEISVVELSHVTLLVSASVPGGDIPYGEDAEDMWADGRESDFFDDEY